ncbi:hypothetical protein Bbelb_392400 [Branchiostoma belcheri]|nr:hypothetical protein Bbelb_392400 [Branchiostoma belcheri]
MAGKCVVTMVMVTSLVCLLRDQTGVSSAPVEPESEGELQIAKKIGELDTNLKNIRETMTAFKDMLSGLDKRFLALDSRVLSLESKYKENQVEELRENFLERLDNMDISLQVIREDVRVFKKLDAKILALEERQDGLEARLAATNENLETAVNASIERADVVEKVDSIVLRVESLENKTATRAQLHEDLVVFKWMGPKILALDERQDGLEAGLDATNENLLEAAVNASIERSEVQGTVDSIVLRVESLENKTVSRAQLHEDLLVFKWMGPKILALDEGHDNLTAALAKTSENLLEMAVNASIERADVVEMVDSVVLKVESLENKTVSRAQLHEDLISTCSTCAATSISTELMAEIMSTVESRFGESGGPAAESNETLESGGQQEGSDGAQEESNEEQEESSGAVDESVDIRLVGGSDSHEGRVEVLYDGQWGTICDDGMDIFDARVVCRQLGYPGAHGAKYAAHFGEGSGPIWMDNVSCTGSETSISQCSHVGWGVHNCGHDEDVGVICIQKNCQVGNGESYRGTVSVTATGKTCQRWDNQTIYWSSHTPENYPSSGLEQNYCRNPDGDKGVWCFTTDPNTLWDYCDVPVCANCQAVDPASYRGTVSVTETGKTCQRWDSGRHPYTHGNYPSSGLEQNYCRNPDGETRVWCFTTESTLSWEYCDVLLCENEISPTLEAVSGGTLIGGGTYGCNHDYVYGENQPWWTVDLGGNYTVSRISLLNRADCWRHLATDETGYRVHGVVMSFEPNITCSMKYVTMVIHLYEGKVSDTARTWREDLRCRRDFPAEDGSPAECNPDSLWGCCSESSWCGYTTDHCDCYYCIDYRSKGVRLASDPSWVVDSTGRLRDAANALDGNIRTYWNSEDTSRYHNNWYIILDLRAPTTLIRIGVNNYGDTTHDTAAFRLQKSLVGTPYSWEDVTSVGNVQAGTDQSQVFGEFRETARYWKFVVTRTHEGYQPWLSELNLYRISAAQRQQNFMVRVGPRQEESSRLNEQCGGAYMDTPLDGQTIELDCDPPISGRYVSILLVEPSDALTLCEVEVYGTS